MARYYGYQAREVGRLSLPQIEGYLKRLTGVLEADAAVNASSQGALIAAMMGR